MLGLIVCAAALAADPSTPPATYAEARAGAGRSPDDQVKLALWCEARGLTAERLHHLTLAILADPGHATARGLLGLVAHDGRWLRPEVVADRLKAGATLLQYEDRRLDAPETAVGHRDLGVWASEHGLPEQARAHLIAATRLDPSLDDAWKRLGYRKHGHRWATQAQLLAEKAEAESRKAADRKWRPVLDRYRQMLGSAGTSDEAEAALADVTDPRAVLAIVRVFARTEAFQPRAVRLLGQIDAPESSRALAYLAVFAQSDKARRAATETLRRRDPREYADALIALLGEPIRFEVKHVDGLESPGELLIEGRRANLRRVYTPPPVLRPGDRPGRDASGRPVVYRDAGVSSGHVELGPMFSQANPSTLSPAEFSDLLPIMEESLAFRPLRPTTAFTFYFATLAAITPGQWKAEAEKSSRATEAKLRDDVQMLEDHNAGVRIGNDRVAGVLNDATGQSLPGDRRVWAAWWVDRIGYASSSTDWTAKDARVENVSIAYQPPALPDDATLARQVIGYDRRSCFGAGTPVRTASGPRPIEQVRVGDRVLTQDIATGALGYRPVVAVHHNPPSPTFRVKLAGEAIVSSPFHRFWVAGQGWAMARDLQAGDAIRTLGGVAKVESNEPGSTRPVYNLDVADDADFFAGTAAALVHDNTLPDPRLVPFDRPAGR